MGLDMFAYRTKNKLINQVDFETSDADVEIAYWRKHPDLHGWMEELYYEQGGTEDTFNCVPVQLELEDLQLLKADIEAGALPKTTGFFFGLSEPDRKHKDLEFVEAAMKAIAEGDQVYYTSWW
jgi:hypothetical protein